MAYTTLFVFFFFQFLRKHHRGIQKKNSPGDHGQHPFGRLPEHEVCSHNHQHTSKELHIEQPFSTDTFPRIGAGNCNH